MLSNLRQITYEITRCTFKNNIAFQGGAIKFTNIYYVLLQDNNFISNHAITNPNTLSVSGNGGAFHYTCLTQECRLLMIGNNFINNSADNSGGAI